MNQLSPNISFKFLGKPVYSASLAVFRVMFGLMLFASIIRFQANGWIEELYIQPKYFFHYYGFEWVKPLGEYTYLLFAVCGISALLFALGWFYRIASVLLFLSFTYIELMDKTNYLNHYYFVSLVLFLMIWLPAHRNLSIDSIRKPRIASSHIPLWTVGSIRLMMSIVYVYAGLAKINSDWLLEAMPLRLWLPAKNDVPVIGPLFNHLWVAYAFSWFGMLYDLLIPFFLLNRKTRLYAYATVVVFHTLTAILFPIGVFPYVMMVSALIFFDTKQVHNALLRLKAVLKWLPLSASSSVHTINKLRVKTVLIMFAIFFAIQLALPIRYTLMPGELFWTEEGYRFSWRVMLMEKMGYAQFVVKDTHTGKIAAVNNNDFLTKNQEKMMATQSDFIVQYAHILKEYFQSHGMKSPAVYATIYVGMNGRRSRLYADATVNLAEEFDSFEPKKWILPLEDEIYGL